MISTIADFGLWALVIILFLGSVLPLSKIPHGMIRGLAFPREQFFGLAVVSAIAAFFVLESGALHLALAVLALVALIQLIYIVKFTSLWRRQSVDADEAQQTDADARLDLIAANVKLSNRDYDRLIDLLRRRQPDIAIAIEVDEDWITALQTALKADYAHWVMVPKDNGYGMCLMSRLALSETQVRSLVVEDVPSIRTAVTLPSGDMLRLYAVHPEPPVIDHDTKGRDSEIALVGLEAKDDPLPSIVTGDLNDVAWSTTTSRFQRLSGLLDPRVGRGFYNTFHAYMPWMRWPLDHLFHDPRFRLIKMERLEKIGSDHFPMLFSLALADRKKAASMPEKSDAEERGEVKDMIRQERKRDREAIGADWEDGG